MCNKEREASENAKERQAVAAGTILDGLYRLALPDRGMELHAPNLKEALLLLKAGGKDLKRLKRPPEVSRDGGTTWTKLSPSTLRYVLGIIGVLPMREYVVIVANNLERPSVKATSVEEAMAVLAELTQSPVDPVDAESMRRRDESGSTHRVPQSVLNRAKASLGVPMHDFRLTLHDGKELFAEAAHEADAMRTFLGQGLTESGIDSALELARETSEEEWEPVPEWLFDQLKGDTY